jgi:hypothetical protein
MGRDMTRLGRERPFRYHSEGLDLAGRGKYRARIMFAGERLTIGRFASAELAAEQRARHDLETIPF